MHTALIIAANFVCIGALTAMFYFLYRDYRIDLLRACLFKIRDRLFEAAEKGLIDFNSEAYIMTRQTLNGMIRYAHSWSIPGLVFFGITENIWGSAPHAAAYAKHHERAIGELSPRAKVAVNSIMNEAHVRLLSHMLHTSILFVLPVMIGKYLVRYMMKNSVVRLWLGHKVAPRAKVVDREAYEMGCVA